MPARRSVGRREGFIGASFYVSRTHPFQLWSHFSLPARSSPPRAVPATHEPPIARHAALAIAVAPVAATEQPIARFIRVTGTLTAEEQADVAAETAGRVVSTPVERGTPVTEGAELVRLSSVETDAQPEGGRGQRRADRGAARARDRKARSTSNEVPEVANAKASLDAGAGGVRPHRVAARPSASSRSRSTTSGKTQVEAARQQYEAAKNGAAAAVSDAAGGARARHARAQGGRRHRRPRAVHRHRRRSGWSRRATT